MRETNQAASTNKNEQTNRPGNPNRSPTQPQQLRPRPKKAMVSVRETNQAASTNKNEQERTGTNTNEQKPLRGKEQRELRHPQARVTEVTGNKAADPATSSTKGAEAPPSPSDRSHREQGSGQQLGNRHEGRDPQDRVTEVTGNKAAKANTPRGDFSSPHGPMSAPTHELMP